MRKRTLLIIQDDLAMTDGLRAILEKAGFRVDTARDVTEAVQNANGTRPAAIIVDQQALGPDWLSLRSQHTFAASLVLVLADKGGLRDLQHIHSELQVSAILEKPVSAAIVAKKLREILPLL